MQPFLLRRDVHAADAHAPYWFREEWNRLGSQAAPRGLPGRAGKA
ncbi:hypothetical protein ABZ820_08660 [Streptomyces diacarni]